MKYLIDIIYILALAIISPKIAYRSIRHNRYRTGWSQRFGKVSRRFPENKCIWIHAVSVGEVNATKTIVDGLKTQLPDYEIIISTTTDTGYARAQAIYGSEHYVFYYPADISWVVKRAFKRLQPDICLLMELEVWPNFSQTAQKLNIPIVVVNGRISDNSFPGYKRFKLFIKPMFERITLALAQTEEYAERFIALGCQADKVKVTNSLKYDTAQVSGTVNGADELKQKINFNDERLIVFGGTGPGEEQIAVNAFKKLKETNEFSDIRAAIVPRKPERFEEVAQLIQSSGLSCTRYSTIKESTEVPNVKSEIILGDTMGDLKKFYSLAAVVFVGRSMVPMGGSDMMEPAALGKFTIFGTQTFNFKQTVDALLKGNAAAEVKDENQLIEVLAKSLSEPEYVKQIAQNAQNVIRQNQGATQKTIEHIKALLS